MSEIQKRWVAYGIVAVAVIIAALLGMRYPMPETPGEVVALGTTHFTNVEAEDITATDDLTVGDRLSVPIIAASDDMTVTDNLVVSDDSMLGNAAGDTTAMTGTATLYGYRDATTGYDYFTTIQGNTTGITNGAKTYGLYVSLTRPAGYGSNGSDLDDAGIKVRVDSHATTTTAGTVLRGIDVEAKADNPGGTVSNIYGGDITAKSDTSAGSVNVMQAFGTNVQNNAAVTTTLRSADFRLFRQAATEPTTEQVVRIRNSSSSGTGCDCGLCFESDDSGATDDFDYIIDMASADAGTADIRLSNSETIKNTTDTIVEIGGFLAFDVGATLNITTGDTITPTASYQPLMVDGTGAAATTDSSTAIADGAEPGQILILINRDDEDIVVKNGANTLFSGDLTLTASVSDTLTLVWDGGDWVSIGMRDN